VRFDFEFEINTLSLLRKAVRLKMLYRVQKHRLRDELVLILKERNPLANIKELNLLCGLGFIHPGIILNKKLSLLMRSVEKRVCWFENQTFRKRKTDDWLIYFIGLLDGLNYPALKKFCLEYALEKRDTKRIVSYKEFMLKKASRLNKLMKPVLLFKLLSPLSYETIIAILSKVDSELAQLNIINFLANYHTVKISINGETIKSLGIKEGPLVRKILKKVHDAKINKKINCESEELEYLKKIIEKN
jgi:tRNA nucleotidyltransferase (CCA-adding enzyme)